LQDEKVSFAAIGGFFKNQEKEYESIMIGEDKIEILAREHHPIFEILLKNGTPDLKLSETELIEVLQKYPWIFREAGSANREWFFLNFPFANKIRIGLELQNNLAIINALEHSDALTALSNLILGTLIIGKSIRPLNHPKIPEIRRQLYLVKNKTKQLNDHEQLFWDGVKTLMQSSLMEHK
jgi:DNA-binding transcriptional LysR family regulator